MGKKKWTATIIVTIIITLVVLAALTYGCIYYLPRYLEADINDIYSLATKLFPLLIGLALIVMSSMIAHDNYDDDVEDADDKLPPNSYDQSLFAPPSDDPFNEDESKIISKKEEISNISVIEEEKTPVVLGTVEPVVEEKVVSKDRTDELFAAIEALSAKVDNLSASINSDEEYDFIEEPSNEEEEEFDLSDDEVYDLVREDRISSLENKVDKIIETIAVLSSMISNGISVREVPAEPIKEEPESIEESIEEIVEEPSVPEEVQVEPEPVAVEEPVEESAEEEVPAEEETIEEVPEPETAEETIEEVSEPETAEETVEEEPVDETLPQEDIEEILDLEVPVIELPVPSVPTLTTVDFDDEEIVDHDSVTDKDFELEGYNNPYKDDPFRFAAYDEFLSAKNNSYDLAICSIDAVVDEISLSLLGRGDTFINKGKTYVILPFLNKEESKSVMDGFGAPYNMECLVAGVGKDFEDILSSIA